MRVIIQQNYEKMSIWAANWIASELNKRKGGKFVLGLPTGSSPLGTYKELIKLCKQKKLSFENTVTFNMDEYVGLGPNDEQSYWHFMWSNFFDYIDIKKENVHILNGLAPDLQKECENYEKAIASEGGIDLFLGGLGADGHIAFNEPFSSLSSRTRVKTLTLDTRIANSRFFGNDVSKVPSQALTVGVGTVTDAREIIILISGRAKARALQAIVEGGVSQFWTASALQLHPKAILVCDEDACGELKVDTYRYFRDIEQSQRL